MIIAFVCSGNICRSPMAESLARYLDDGGHEFVSAGTYPDTGWPATSDAGRVVCEIGASLDGHQARGLDALRDRAPNLIYVMEHHHQRAVSAFEPGWQERLDLLDPGGETIPDPYQRGEEFYRQVRDQIIAALEYRSQEWGTFDAREKW